MLVEKKASANTIDAYRNDLEQFSAFLRSHQPNGNAPFDWNRVTSEAVTAFVLELKDKGRAEATIARKVAAIKSFFRFLALEGVIDSDPTENMESPRVNRPLPKTLTPQEIDKLLEQPTKNGTPGAIRDLAMLELAYATGLRANELVSLNLDCIYLDPQQPYVHCIGKGDKERTIPIKEVVVDHLAAYLNNGRTKLTRNKKDQALFLNHNGKRLSRQGFWLILKEYADDAGLKGKVTPETLRHSFAAHNLRDGVSLRRVQNSMGHKTSYTTQRYKRLLR